jgi:putative ABC transport system permease protein
LANAVNELTLPIRNLLARPVRTSLTTLGIAVAVAGFVALTGLTQGVQHSYAGGFEESGGDFVVSQRNSFSVDSSVVPETLAPALAAVDGVEAVSGVLMSMVTADDTANVVVAGWPPESFLWQGLDHLEGRLPTATDQWPVVLGRSIADGLNKRVGDTITLQDQPYQVVGIASFSSVLNKNIALVPLKGLQALNAREGTVTLYQVHLFRPLDPGRIAAAKAGLEQVAPGYEVGNTDEFTNNIHFFSLIQAIASTVSLVVMAMAALAIANTLLMAVNERTFEIGILSAIGWTATRILRLILMEGIVMSVIGGTLGLGLGIVTMDLVSRTKIAAGMMERYVTTGIVVQAMIAVFAAGSLGALYPAWRATRLVPAEALRRT